MNGISHEQAQRFIRAELDGLLTEALRHDLEAHLRECEACRVESESLSMLTMRLRSNFQGRWDAQDGPSQKVMANIHSQTRRIIMSNRIRFGLRTLAGIGALIMLGFLINFAFAQLRNPSITVSGPDATNGVLPAKQSPLIAFVSDQNGNSEIYTVNTDGTDLTNLTNNPANDTSPAWSPDGTRLAFLSDRNGQWDIFLMRSDGSELTQLTDGKEIGNGFSWSPNGKQIAYSAISTQDPRLQSIVIMNSNGSDVQEAIDGLSGGLINDSGLINNKRADDIYLNWSPDGSKLAFWEEIGQSEKDVKTKFYAVNADGTNLLELTNVDGVVLEMRWQDDHIIALATRLTETGERNWELYRLSMDGAPSQKLASQNKRIVNWFGDLPNLTYIVNTGPVTWSWFMTDGKESIPLNVWKNNFQDCRAFEVEMQIYDALSPNGEKLLVSSFCNEGLNWFYLVNKDGSEITRLIREPIKGQVFDQITWSPDDEYLVFGVYPDTSQNFNFDYYFLNVADALANPTTRPTRLTTDNTQNKRSVIIQPISDYEIVEEKPTPEQPQTSTPAGLIAFVSGKEAGNEEIFTMNADGSGLTNITNDLATDTSPAWSPDGKRIAFGSDRKGDMDIYVMDADGSNLSRLTDDRGYEGNFSWSPDGQKIVYVSSDNSLNENGQLMIMNADGSNKITLTSEQGSYNFLDWSPDGKKILFEDLNSYPNDSGMRYVDDVGSNTGDGLMGVGDGLHRYARWENSDQYVFASLSGAWDSPKWELISFYAIEPSPQYNFGPVLYSSDSPIVAIFDRTFMVENNNTLTWLVYEGGPLPFSSWDFNERCIEPSNLFQEDSTHIVSPNRQQAFVAIHCAEGTTWFYLENADGSQFVQLTDFSVPDPSRVIDTSWSLDGKYVTVIINRIQGDQYIGADLYLFDIEKMLKDPSVKPIQLTTDGAMKYGAVWQPVTNNKIVKEKPTPGPLSFSLNTNEAETLAGFDVLEPSYLPTGYTLEGVAYDPQTQKVAIKYNSQQNDGTLFIYQQRGDLLNYPDVRAYVTPVPLGDTEGEFLRGAWIYESPDTTTPRWDATAETYSLTWQMGEIFYTITFIGGETIPPILMDNLMAIAKNMK